MSLSRQQLEAINLLGRGKKTSEVATELSLTQRTIQRWLKNDEFASALREITTKTTKLVVESTSFDLFREIEDATQASVDLLKQFIEDPDLRPSDRLKAIDIVRRWGDRHRFEAEIERELNKILRHLEKLMVPEHYSDLLVALSAMGHEDLEAFAQAKREDLSNAARSILAS